MDTVGTSATKWYGSHNSSGFSSSWISCSGFYDYQQAQSNTDVGLRTNMYEIASNESFASISSYADVLLGSLLHVKGSSGDYSHAIIVTDVYGPSREQVYFCAHNTMRKGEKLADRYPTCKIRVFERTFFTTNISINTRRITATLYRPVPAGTQLPLYAATGLSCYRITTAVTAPSGTTTTSTTYNSATATRNYTFTEVGLYTIHVSAYETSSSSPVDYYYSIRIY